MSRTKLLAILTAGFFMAVFPVSSEGQMVKILDSNLHTSEEDVVHRYLKTNLEALDLTPVESIPEGGYAYETLISVMDSNASNSRGPAYSAVMVFTVAYKNDGDITRYKPMLVNHLTGYSDRQEIAQELAENLATRIENWEELLEAAVDSLENQR